MSFSWRTEVRRRYLSCVNIALVGAITACIIDTATAGIASAQTFEPPTLHVERPALQRLSACDRCSPLEKDLTATRQTDAESPTQADTGPGSQATANAQQTGENPADAQTQTGPAALDRRDRIFYPGDTERPRPLVRKLALNILLDEKELFTSPFHMNRNNAKWWLFPAAITAVLIAEDRRISNSLENSRGQVVWGGRISQIGAPYTIVPIIAGYYGFGVLVDHPKAREIGVLGTESVVDSLILVEVLKLAAGRSRPDERHPGDFWSGGQSFPSGHAIQTWALASLISHEYQHQPLVAVVAYGLAATVSASRIAARQHFASDIFVGGAMGWFIGRYVYNTHMSHLAHKHASLVPIIVPQYQAATRSYGVTLLFASGGFASR